AADIHDQLRRPDEVGPEQEVHAGGPRQGEQQPDGGAHNVLRHHHHHRRYARQRRDHPEQKFEKRHASLNVLSRKRPTSSPFRPASSARAAPTRSRRAATGSACATVSRRSSPAPRPTPPRSRISRSPPARSNSH